MWMFNKHNLAIAKFANTMKIGSFRAVHFFKDKTVATDSVTVFEVDAPKDPKWSKFPAVEGYIPEAPGGNGVISLRAKDVMKLKIPKVGKEDPKEFECAVIANHEKTFASLIATNIEDVNVALCHVVPEPPPEYDRLFTKGADVVAKITVDPARLGAALMAAAKIAHSVKLFVRKPGAPIEIHGKEFKTGQAFRAMVMPLKDDPKAE